MAEGPKLRPEVADVFRRLDALNLKQRELAQAIGIEENKVSKVRGGERQFKAPELLAAVSWLNAKEDGAHRILKSPRRAQKLSGALGACTTPRFGWGGKSHIEVR